MVACPLILASRSIVVCIVQPSLSVEETHATKTGTQHTACLVMVALRSLHLEKEESLLTASTEYEGEQDAVCHFGLMSCRTLKNVLKTQLGQPRGPPQVHLVSEVA